MVSFRENMMSLLEGIRIVNGSGIDDQKMVHFSNGKMTVFGSNRRIIRGPKKY
jgi:hypothetical protein